MSINYPHGIPFWKDVKFITVFFRNNEDKEFNIHFVKKKKVNELACIIFPHETKKYRFPEKTIVAVLNHNSKTPICYIKLKDGWTYTYP